jgi:hypothetical protein
VSFGALVRVFFGPLAQLFHHASFASSKILEKKVCRSELQLHDLVSPRQSTDAWKRKVRITAGISVVDDDFKATEDENTGAYRFLCLWLLLEQRPSTSSPRNIIFVSVPDTQEGANWSPEVPLLQRHLTPPQAGILRSTGNLVGQSLASL